MRSGFDGSLPGQGLLVWRVDEDGGNTNLNQPALQLIQADGRRNLEDGYDNNRGDSGDPFPGSKKVKFITDRTDSSKSTSFPGGLRSGITVSSIKYSYPFGVRFILSFSNPSDSSK